MNLQRFLEPAPRLPPEETWGSLFHNSNYLLAFHYFLLNTGLLLLAWLLGCVSIQLINHLYERNQFSTPNPSTKQSFTLPLSAHIFLRLVVGLAVIIAIIFILALFNWLKPQTLLPVLALSALLAAILKIWLFTKNRSTSCRSPLISCDVLADIIFILLTALILFCLPDGPTIGDSTSFHAPYADFFLQNHGLSVNEFMIYPYHTFNLNIFYSMGLMLAHNLTYLQTLHGLFAVITMLGLYGFARAMRLHLLICLLLPFIFIDLFPIRFNAIQANVDLGGMCFSFAAFFALWCWSESKKHSHLVVASICLGMAIGTKYILLAMIPPAILALFLLEPRNFIRNAILCAVWLLAWGSWWYIRNTILIGNPVHPFASGIFGYRIWTEADMASQLSASNQWIPRSPLGLLLLLFYAYKSGVLVTQDICTLLVLMFISTIFSRALPSRTNILLITAWCWTISWVWGSQDPRHFLPAAPLVLIHFSALAHKVMSSAFKITHKALHTSNQWLCILLQSVLILPAVILAALTIREKIISIYYKPLIPTAESVAELRRNSPVYDTFMAANTLFSKKEIVYEFFNRDGYWFFIGKLAGTQFGPHGYWTIAQESTKPGYSGMQPERLQHVLRRRYNAAGFIIPNPPFLPYNQAEFDTYFKLLYRNKECSIYRFKIQP